MENKINKFLFDILESIRKIYEFLGEPLVFENYIKNSMLQNAVERNIEIIGEAVKKLLELNPEFKITNARKIVNTRNKISHGYDEIDSSEIWNIIINHLPLLKKEVESFIKS
ncbi:MAG: DUF86 domain-containing protein [Alphaproteobacteria bacterium]|nr:DUF86 domain-containing protein [Alphaproteobacteria bacterium]